MTEDEAQQTGRLLLIVVICAVLPTALAWLWEFLGQFY